MVADAQSPLWYAVWMPVAFAAYLLGVLGFAVLGPLSAPAGREVGDGVLAELSGPDLLVVQRGALRAARRGRRGRGPALPRRRRRDRGCPARCGCWSRRWLLTAALAWVAGRLPVLRVHRLMEPLWTVLLPLVVVQDLVVAVVVVGR